MTKINMENIEETLSNFWECINIWVNKEQTNTKGNFTPGPLLYYESLTHKLPIPFVVKITPTIWTHIQIFGLLDTIRLDIFLCSFLFNFPVNEFMHIFSDKQVDIFAFPFVEYYNEAEEFLYVCDLKGNWTHYSVWWHSLSMGDVCQAHDYVRDSRVFCIMKRAQACLTFLSPESVWSIFYNKLQFSPKKISNTLMEN